MPYPIELPKMKHKFICPPLPSTENNNDESIIDQYRFNSTASLFQSLENIEPTNYKELSPVYTYSDAPTTPLSRDLIIIGFADTTLSIIRKLNIIDNDDDENDSDNNNNNNILHKCTIAVKRIDNNFINKVQKIDIINSLKFTNFLKLLYKNKLVGIISLDKYKRFGIIQPTSDYIMPDNDNNNEGQNYSSICYFGQIDKIKNLLQMNNTNINTSKTLSNNNNSNNGNHNKQQTINQVSTTSDFNIDEGVWQPPSSDNNGDENTNNDDDGDNGLWKPPGADDDDDENDMNNNTNSTGFSAWEPTNNDSNNQPMNVDDDNDNKFHADSGAAAADRFYSGLTRALDTRANSRLYHMRSFNGWVKGTQIQELDPKTKSKNIRVLDLACGKGGDLGKWVLHSRGLGNYVGIDVARGSLLDAALRARKMKNKFYNNLCTFTCADLGSDVPGRYKSNKYNKLQKLSTWSLNNEKNTYNDPEFKLIRGGGISLNDKFDVVSVQFAIHYMMQTRKRARRFFQTVSQLLEIGGNLIATTIDARVVLEHLTNLGLNLHFDNNNDTNNEGNANDSMDVDNINLEGDPIIVTGEGACKITFEPKIIKKIFTPTIGDLSKGEIDENLFGLEYTFTLVEGSDHESGVGDAVNLPEWLIPIPVLEALGKEAGLELEYAQNFHEFYYNRSDPNKFSSAHSTMYNMKVLNMKGSISKPEWEISRLYVAIKFRKVRESTRLIDDDEDNDMNDDDDDDEDDDTPIDPIIKAKFYPMALMKAKKTIGNDIWSTLSSEDKNNLTDIELRKMVPKK